MRSHVRSRRHGRFSAIRTAKSSSSRSGPKPSITSCSQYLPLPCHHCVKLNSQQSVTMRLSQLAATLLALLGNAAFAKPVVVQSRDTVHVAAKYCDASTSICYSEFISPEKIAYRFAIPDNATAGNFDVLLQIVAPKAVGWAGLAWGGVSKSFHPTPDDTLKSLTPNKKQWSTTPS